MDRDDHLLVINYDQRLSDTRNSCEKFTVRFNRGADNYTKVKKLALYRATISNSRYDMRATQVNTNLGTAAISNDWGFYDTSGLETLLTNALILLGHAGVSVNFDSVKRKFTVTTSLAFDINVAAGDLWTYLGFATNRTGLATYTADNSFIQAPETYVINLNVGTKNARFPTKQASFIVLEDEELDRTYFTDNELNQKITVNDVITDIEVSIYDENMNLVSMNGGYCELVLKVIC